MDQVEAVASQEIAIGMVLGVGARCSHPVGVTEFGATVDELVDDLAKSGAVLGIRDRGSIPAEVLAAQADSPGSEQHGARSDPHDPRRAGPGVGLPDPEEEVDMRLVGGLVGGETDVGG